MNKYTCVFFVCFTLAFSSGTAGAEDFQPLVMDLDILEDVEYSFDGSLLSIPVNVAGVPAAVWLVINTRGMADSIVDVRNGHLGWHYVNRIDTTVYVSDRQHLPTGDGIVEWDGRNQDGNLVPAAEYDCFIWGYDDANPRTRVSDYVRTGFDWDSEHTFLITHGDDGLPLPQPFFFGAQHQTFSNDDVIWQKSGTHFKWVIGSDPSDVTNLQTTMCSMYKNKAFIDSLQYGGPSLAPDDHSVFYHASRDVYGQEETVLKWSWVEGGEAVLDEEWGGFERLSWDNPADPLKWTQKPTIYSDGSYMYVAATGHQYHDAEWNKLKCINYDGELVFDKMLHDWYYPDDGNQRDYVNGHIVHMDTYGANRWLLMGYNTCLMQVVDTTRLLADPNDETDMVVFENANGDFFMDADTSPAWHCLEYEMRRDSISIDANNFGIIGTTNYGLISFGVMTQDGTGIDLMSFADDVVPTYEGEGHHKGGIIISDIGSMYDGIYVNEAVVANEKGHFWYTANYVPFDSASGVITPKPVSVGELPQGFSVSQNSPNPFNPSTTISFHLAGDGEVNLDVYNVAGQQVACLLDNDMSAGDHSVRWDADGFPAGVYFYTLAAGEYSRTMKMTLVK